MITGNMPAHAVARRVTFGAGALCSVAGWVIAGSDGLAGAAVATLLVVVFLSTGMVPVVLARGAKADAALGLGVLLLTFTLRLALALVAFVLISRADFADARWVGLTIIVTALTWIAVHAVSAVRGSRTELTIVPEASQDEGGE